MDVTKTEYFQRRAIEIAQDYIEKQVSKLDDEKLENLTKAILITSAAIAGQLIAEYDENKKNGNI